MADEEWTEVTAKPKKAGGGGGGGGGYSEARPPIRGAGASSGARASQVSMGDRNEEERKVVVTGLTQNATEPMLREAFRKCGYIEDVVVARESGGTSRGFAFVVFGERGAAAMAARDGVFVDGKLCAVRVSRPKEERSSREAGSADRTAAGKEVMEFVNRREFSDEMRQALLRTDQKTALRVVRQLEATGGNIQERVVYSELGKAARSSLSSDLEWRISDWVSELDLDTDMKERVQNVLLGQRAEEIEHILEQGRNKWWTSALCKKETPQFFLLGCIKHFRKDGLEHVMSEFCQRFGFAQEIQWKLSQLTTERARKLMQSWNPSGISLSKSKGEFQIMLEQALVERKQFELERWRKSQQEISAVASHARIIDEWSDDEEDDGGPAAGLGAALGRRRVMDDDSMVLVEGDWEDNRFPSTGKHGPLQQRGLAATAEHFSICSLGEPSGTAQSSSAKPQKSRQAKPTHFIMCVDTSGSMLTQDCKEENGWSLSRMDAVLKTCSDFVTESMMNREDVYSFVTFNEESVLHFSCQSAFNACEQLSNLRPIAEKQTLFAMGIRGIEAAIKREKKGLPSHVVFLSDGEPTDPDTYLRDLHVLLRKRAGSTLKIYTVGFGESAKVNAREGDFTYLQQLASLGRGHFQRCGASLCSLQGAFTALTSTISRTRESSTRRSTTERETLGTSGSAASTRANAASVGDGTAGNPQSASAWPNMEDAIAEGDEESDLESEGSQHEEALNGSRSKFPDVQFELPAPDIIFKDVMNKDLWRNFTAAKTSFKFNGRSFARSAEVSKVFLRHKPFMKGGMRLVYGMVLEEGARAPGKAEHMMCAKRTFEDLEKDHGFQAHSAFCRSTAVAKYFGQKFRKDTQQALAAAVQFGFLDCHLYSPVGTGEDGYHFCGEAYLNGHFVKLNSNAGYVNETDYNEHSMIAQAFSHYTFDKSHGELLVVDLQGICGEVKDDPYFLLTDPQVHSRCGTFDKFGSGDHGDQGVSTFFNKHRCGPICKALNLRKDYEVRPPTHIISIPGVQSCLDFLQPRRFWMKKISGANQFIMPKQASKDKDWLDIQLWARPHSGEKFKELVNKSLEVYYEASRQILFLEQAWTAEVWKEKLDQWQSSSGAAVVAYPSDWRETAPSELWVFSEKSESGWVDHKKANWALSKIKEELESSPPDHVPGQSPTSKPAKQDVWTKYFDRQGDPFWYRESDCLWFMESDPGWERFLDETSGRYWWWDKENGNWFFEPPSAVAA